MEFLQIIRATVMATVMAMVMATVMVTVMGTKIMITNMESAKV